MSETKELEFNVTSRSGGYAHVRLSGTCDPSATREDVERRFFHPYFGGRDAGVDGKGKFWCIVHTD